MILQTLDIENNCTGVFHDNKIILDNYQDILQNYNLAWRHTPMLNDEKYKYLFLLLKQEELSHFCHDSELFKKCKIKMLAHQKAATAAKINFQESCFFDLIPEHQLLKWFQIRKDALLNLYNTKSFDEDYNILHKIHVLTTNISRQNIIFNKAIGRVVYNMFGSATGRLTTNKGSVPVLTLKKEQRNLLEPSNDAFVELDLNAAEIRMLMALSGKEQPQGDIHNHLQNKIFGQNLSRSTFKEKLFAWLYNPVSKDLDFDSFFSRKTFKNFYDLKNHILKTPFGRKLQVEERKAQNYLLQSTTSDQVLENAYKIQKMLKHKKSKIAFTLHDSIILDMSLKDAIMLKDIKNQFEYTRWGMFPST